MQVVTNLLELLVFNVRNLYNAERQIAQFIPLLIEKAKHTSLKNALKHHLDLSNQQKQRLAEITSLINDAVSGVSFAPLNEEGTASEDKAIAGLTQEINDLLEMNMSTEVIDAAIIASVQKIEHYEIAAYGTVVSYAQQLKLHTVQGLLTETLQEEYDADDLLTALATAAINKESLPSGLQLREEFSDKQNTGTVEEDQTPAEHAAVSISERTINSPGGRAGTSHRGYGNGESRGH